MPMKCPDCQHPFNPLRVLLIHRWNSLVCPSCKARFNRRVDIQLVLVVLLCAGILKIGSWTYQDVGVVIAGIVCLIVIPLVDAATIRLHRTTEQKGWRRLLGE